MPGRLQVSRNKKLFCHCKDSCGKKASKHHQGHVSVHLELLARALSCWQARIHRLIDVYRRGDIGVLDDKAKAPQLTWAFVTIETHSGLGSCSCKKCDVFPKHCCICRAGLWATPTSSCCFGRARLDEARSGSQLMATSQGLRKGNVIHLFRRTLIFLTLQTCCVGFCQHCVRQEKLGSLQLFLSAHCLALARIE